jgi:hypothetical protein
LCFKELNKVGVGGVGRVGNKNSLHCSRSGERDTMRSLGAINSDRELSLKCTIYCLLLIITTQLKMRCVPVNFHPLAVYNRIRGSNTNDVLKAQPGTYESISIIHSAPEKGFNKIIAFISYNNFVLNFGYSNTRYGKL